MPVDLSRVLSAVCLFFAGWAVGEQEWWWAVAFAVLAAHTALRATEGGDAR